MSVITFRLIQGWLWFQCAGATTERPWLTVPAVEQTTTELAILSPVPLSGGWVGGHTMRIGAEISKDIINSQQKILPGYHLSITWLDDMCNPTKGMQTMLDAWMNSTKWIALGANGCSAVCMSNALVTTKIRIPHISYGCASGSISNTAKYPDITRMMTVENSMADVFESLGTKWDWKEIKIITGAAARFDAPAQYLMDFFKGKAIKTTWLTPRNPNWEDSLALMQRVKTSQQRAVVVLGYEPFYRKIVCASYKVGIPKGVVWMSVGWHKAGWWTNYDPDMMDAGTGFAPDCTVSIIEQFYEGGIGAAGLGQPADMDQQLTCLEGYTARTIRDSVIEHFTKGYPIGENILPGSPYWGIMGNAPDGICIWAYLMRHMIFDLKYVPDDLRRPNFTTYTEMIRFIKYDIDFKGTSGQVKFWGKNDLPGLLAVYQTQRDAKNNLIKTMVGTVDLAGNMAEVAGETYKFPDGSTAPGSVFKACPPGSALNAAGNCDSCAPGTYHDCNWANGQCTGTKNCALCPAAFASSKVGAVDRAACQACTTGRFNPKLGASTCTNCSKGRAGPSIGLTSCSSCLPGEFAATESMSGCPRCPKATFSSNSSASSCVTCPAGKETFGLGARSFGECVCSEGTYANTADVCLACPEKMTCDQGSAEVNFVYAGQKGDGTKIAPKVDIGFWSSTEEPLSVFTCFTNKDCPGGPPQTCHDKLIGQACSLCPDGTVKTAQRTCKECGDDSGPRLATTAAACIFGTLMFAVMHIFINWPQVKLLRANMIGVYLGGMAVTEVLVFNIYGSLDVIWEPPLATLFAAMKILKFDADMLNLTCMLGTDSKLGMYVVKLLALPIAFCILLTGVCFFWLFPMIRPYCSLNKYSLINSVGLLLSIFFIAICNISLEGFTCSENPNGKFTLVTDRSVICWEGGKHAGFVVFSIIALIVYPVTFLTGSGFIVFNYNKWATKGGPNFVQSVRFLIARMDPEMLSFGFWYNIRNFALALVPVILSSNFGIQVLGLLVVTLIWLVAQMHYLPWRFPVLNYFDVLISCGNVLLLCCFAMIGGLDAKLSAGEVGWMIVLIFCLLVLLLVFLGAGKFIMGKFKGKEYGTFLCHAKSSAGLFGRQVKMMLNMYSNRKCFLDVDELENLDNLNFTVRTNVDNLVIMATVETFYRFWCAMEITSAVINNVKIIVAKVSSALEKVVPDDAMENFGAQDQAEMDKLGISLELVGDAYKHCRTLPVFSLLSDAPTLEMQTHYVKQIAGALTACPMSEKHIAAESGLASFIVYDTKCPTQSCVARCILMLLQQDRWASVLCADETAKRLLKFEGDSGGQPLVPVSVILISKNFHENPVSSGFTTLMKKKGCQMVTVLSQEEFPDGGKAAADKLIESGGLSPDNARIIDGICPGATDADVGEALRGLFKILAWRVNPQDTESVMKTEFGRVVGRMRVTRDRGMVADVKNTGLEQTSSP